jgi:hypothetical protein
VSRSSRLYDRLTGIVLEDLGQRYKLVSPHQKLETLHVNNHDGLAGGVLKISGLYTDRGWSPTLQETESRDLSGF